MANFVNKRLGKSGKSHNKAVLNNLLTSLFEHQSIKTTLMFAKTLRPYAEKVLTKAKKAQDQKDLSSIREISTHLKTKSAIHNLYDKILVGIADRKGGYLRITKLLPRKGDCAKMAVIEFTDSINDK